MNYKIDHCEPFDGKNENIWMKCEHIGRYIFARDFFADKGEKLLDVACAEGFGAYVLSGGGYDVVGADINAEYIEKAKGRCDGKFFVLDFEKDEFPDEMQNADGAICFETIEHLRDGRKLLTSLYGAVKNGGYVLLSFPSDRFEKVDENGVNYDPYHLKIYSEEEMLSLVESIGFEKADEYGQGLCNLLYAAESAAEDRGALAKNEADKFFNYDEEKLTKIAHVFGYPDKQNVGESYSHIWVLKKN